MKIIYLNEENNDCFGTIVVLLWVFLMGCTLGHQKLVDESY